MVAAAGVAAFAVVCCAGLPLALGLLAGLTLAGVVGVGGGVLAVAAGGSLVYIALRARRRRACATGDRGTLAPTGTVGKS